MIHTMVGFIHLWSLWAKFWKQIIKLCLCTMHLKPSLVIASLWTTSLWSLYVSFTSYHINNLDWLRLEISYWYIWTMPSYKVVFIFFSLSFSGYCSPGIQKVATYLGLMGGQTSKRSLWGWKGACVFFSLSNARTLAFDIVFPATWSLQLRPRAIFNLSFRSSSRISCVHVSIHAHQETGKSYVAPTRGYRGYTHHMTLSVVPIALVSLRSLVSGLGSGL